MCMPLAYIHSEADGDADAMGEVAGEAEGDGDSDSEAEGDGVAEADSEAEQGHGMVPCGGVGSVECQPLRHASKRGKDAQGICTRGGSHTRARLRWGCGCNANRVPCILEIIRKQKATSSNRHD